MRQQLSMDGRQRRKLHVAWLSVISNSALVIMKFTVGFLIGSLSIISEALHSGVDLIAALIALFSVKKSSLPADTGHPFGHGKVENISGTIEALLIFLASGWIIYEAIHKLLDQKPIEYASWGVGVMLISTVVNMIVSEKLFKVAKETESIALEADACHLRADVYTSAGVMVSLALIWISQWVYPEQNISWLDSVAAIGVALLIVRTAYQLTLRSVGDLMDVKLPEEEVTWIKGQITTQKPLIQGFHRLRTRKAGPFRFIDFHIKVDPRMSVEVSHRISDELTDSIKKRFPDASVTVHVEPCEGNCTGECLSGCFLSKRERENTLQKQNRVV